MEMVVHPGGVANWRGRRYHCALGRGGVTSDKREGDGATPAGVFGLCAVLHRADRVTPPQTMLPLRSIAPEDGWCDAPGDANYNRQVVLPYGASCEQLWREDRLYDILVVTDYNLDPVMQGRGSAIFLHIAQGDFEPTEGCIAFTPDDLRSILADWQRGDTVRVEPLESQTG